MRLTMILTLLATLLGTTDARAVSVTLQELWQLPGLANPESVVLDPITNALYVSNVSGNPTDKDGNGFISKVSPDGHLLELKWVDGLDAPKGLAVLGNRLYTADIDTLVEIDVAQARVVARHRLEDAEFLNDVACARDGAVYVSDMFKNRICILKNGTFTVWLEAEDLQSPNGLLVDGDRLIVAAWGAMNADHEAPVGGCLKAVALSDQTITDLGDGRPLGHLDGLEPYGDQGFFVTDWMAGKLLFVTRQGQAQEVSTLEQGTADLGFVMLQQTILLPMMNSNTLRAYRVTVR